MPRCLSFEEQVVKGTDMVVREHVALGVADLPVPDVDTVSIESEARQVVDISVDGLLDGDAEALVRAKRVRERRRVVHTEECNFLLEVLQRMTPSSST